MPKGRCPVVLEEGATEKVCIDLKERRRLILCQAWKLHESQGLPFKLAMKQAWEETKTACSEE